MSFFNSLIDLAADVVTTPIAVAQDVVKVATLQKPTNTEDKIKDVADDAKRIVRDVTNL